MSEKAETPNSSTPTGAGPDREKRIEFASPSAPPETSSDGARPATAASAPAAGPNGPVSGQSNRPMSKPAHALAWQDVVAELGGDAQEGLSGDEARKRLQEFGRNELDEEDGVNILGILVAQVANAMTLVLILAMSVSFGIQAWIEGGVIAFVIMLNISVGFFQEYSAQKTMASLRSLSSPTATVIRDGEAKVVPSGEIVPGDLVEVKMGDTMPADMRLIEAVNFETDEATLTGESLPVRKNEEGIFDPSTGPGDRTNVAYSSTGVTKGRAKGIVFATGTVTEIGLIAAALNKKVSRRRPVKRNESGKARPHRYVQAWSLTSLDAFGRFLGVNKGTPLQKKLARLAVLLFLVAVVCAFIVIAVNDFSSSKEVIIYAVATGVCMIPASLIVVLTITMSDGTRRMVKRNVIVRNLKSLEALGAVTDICSDKTGTLTQGKMVARGAWLPGMGTYTVENFSSPYDPTQGDIRFDSRKPCELPLKEEPEACGAVTNASELLNQSKHGLAEFLRVASLANLATVSDANGRWHARGDPTEIAIQVFASRFGWNRLSLLSDWSEVAELPFDSDVKRMSVIMKENSTGQQYALTKGAVERVLATCTTYCPGDSDESAPITEEFTNHVFENMRSLASLGLRVLALASKPFPGNMKKGDEVEREAVECDLVFRGLIGLYDPPRPESAPAVRHCHEAGICVHMLTGDHPETAKAIAIEVGILPARMDQFAPEIAGSMCMAATDFDALTDDQIDQLPMLPLVIARCAPSTKVRMIEALHRLGKFAAMTGDGVNDSPSLRRADVGIAMGQSGSDVAKDVSDIVLADDNFASIVAAIEEGRRIFDNIQKFVLHVLATNVGQACILLIGLAFKDEGGLSVFPLAPVEIVWIIMATSGLPDMGLGFERAVPDILQRPPQSIKVGIFTWELIVDTLVYGLWIAVLCLASFTLVVYRWGGGNLGTDCNNNHSDACDVVFRARATTFACLTWFALFLAWELVDTRRSFFRMTPDSPHYLTQWARDVWRNKFLFWAIVIGFTTLFPLLYIPELSTRVFKHSGIGKEWGIVVVAVVLFFGGVECWKWAKRVYFRRKEWKNNGPRGRDLERGAKKEKEWTGAGVVRRWESEMSERSRSRMR